MRSNPIHWFEIPVTDMERAVAFYEQAFLISLDKQEVAGQQMAWFPMEEGAAGSSGTLVIADAQKPSHDGCTLYFPVQSIKTTLEQIVQAGGKVLVEESEIGEYGKYALFEDTEGNRLGLHQD